MVATLTLREQVLATASGTLYAIGCMGILKGIGRSSFLAPTAGRGVATAHVLIAFAVATPVSCVPVLVAEKLFGTRGNRFPEAVNLTAVGAMLWDSLAIAFSPEWYSTDFAEVAAAGATCLYGLGVSLFCGHWRFKRLIMDSSGQN